ncbi:MAG TPA: c-type cytochrome [Candidatus Acidoferrum sp.]|nr:c-type cytochrome [Candidatus Acidoferrum sp.]
MSVASQSFLLTSANTFRITRQLTSLVAVTLLAIFALSPAASPQDARKSPVKPSQPSSSTSRGQQIFDSSCASCHGLDGRGGERAPDIATRPEITHRSDQDLLKLLRAGIPEKGMPPFAGLGSTKLSALLNYVRSLQGKGTAIPVVGNTEMGKELYSGKAGCSECHMVNGAGGFLGPDLSKYGENHSVAEIRSAIVKPEKIPGTRGHVAEVTAKDGKIYSGLVRNEDNFSLQLLSLDGTFHFFSKSDIAATHFRPEPLMPAGYDSKLSAAELDALAAYIASLSRMKQKRGDGFEF